MASSELYCSAQDIRNAINMTSDSDDGIITGYIAAVSRLIDGFMGRKETGFQAIQTATSRVYAGNGERWLFINECIEITAVNVKDAITDATYDTVLASTEYEAFRGSYSNPNFNDMPYDAIMLSGNATINSFYVGNAINYHEDVVSNMKAPQLPTVQVTARWGYADTIPEVIKTAAIMQTTRIYKRLQGGMADALLTADLGQARFISKLDKDVQVLLNMSTLHKPTFVER
jgi:hypothetical protein